MAVVPMGTNGIHELCVANSYDLIRYMSDNAFACHLFDIADLTTVGSLIGESIAQRSTNGMGREVFDMGSEMQEVMFVAGIRVNSSDGK